MQTPIYNLSKIATYVADNLGTFSFQFGELDEDELEEFLGNAGDCDAKTEEDGDEDNKHEDNNHEDCPLSSRQRRRQQQLSPPQNGQSRVPSHFLPLFTEPVYI